MQGIYSLTFILLRIRVSNWHNQSRDTAPLNILTLFALKVNFFHPVSLTFLLSILFNSRMVLVPLNSWYFISVEDTGSSEWYANTTLVAPSYKKEESYSHGTIQHLFSIFSHSLNFYLIWWRVVFSREGSEMCRPPLKIYSSDRMIFESTGQTATPWN